MKLEVEGLRKEFGPIIANECVNIQLKNSEVHCILGENGAGKTTLMNCIYGIYKPDDGIIRYEGEEITQHSVADSIERGIGMVHQHFMLVHNMTVLENVMLGLRTGRSIFLDRKKVTYELQCIMETYKISLDLSQEIRNLSVGAQQSVEILKALYRRSSLLILDEPTAVLTPAETREFFRFIREYTAQGNSVLLITHKLEEILDISHRITVMRNGRSIGTYNRHEIKDKNELASKMVGESIELSLSNTERGKGSGIEVLKVESLVVKDNRGLNVVDGISFSMNKGEILGIAGVSGNGQTELAEALAGIRVPSSGTFSISGEIIQKNTPRKSQLLNLRYVPEDRHRYGLVLRFSVRDNFLLSRYYEHPFSIKGRFNHKYINGFSLQKVEEFNILTPGIDVPVEHLSGGNQQKLILARELASQPDVLIATQPTRGLDVAAAKFVQKSILDQKKMGTAILYVSNELEEIMDMCDRIMVMYKGKIVGNLDAAHASKSEIGAMMAGNIKNQNEPITTGEVVL